MPEVLTPCETFVLTEQNYIHLYSNIDVANNEYISWGSKGEYIVAALIKSKRKSKFKSKRNEFSPTIAVVEQLASRGRTT